MSDVFIILTVIFVFGVAVWEGATSVTLGVYFIKSEQYVSEMLSTSTLNNSSHRILSIETHSPTSAWFISDSCSSLLSRYYIYTHDYGTYRVWRGGKIHYMIKNRFNELKKTKQPRPKF